MGKILIAGGGIIGLFTAYYLVESGHDITLIDRGDLSYSCSTGNAGMIVPSHVIPLASPGVVAKGLKWMFSSKSPFFINPKLDRDLIQWAWRFYRSANTIHVEKSMLHLKNLGLYSKELYQQFVDKHHEQDFFWKESGLLLIYRTAIGEKDETTTAGIVRSAGLDARVLSKEQLKILEPAIDESVRGAVQYPDDALISPDTLTAFLKRYLENKGIAIVSRQTIDSFIIRNKKLMGVRCGDRQYECDHLVVAAGAWSSQLARQLALSIPMRAGKGYSFLENNVLHIRQPAILSEKKVTVSPYGKKIRFGGTMEITGLNLRMSPQRVKGIVESIGQYYTGHEQTIPTAENVWRGLRPVSPDGMPYIGFSKWYNNVVFATGHSMMGLSLATATGKIVSDLIAGDDPPFSLHAFSPDRYHL